MTPRRFDVGRRGEALLQSGWAVEKGVRVGMTALRLILTLAANAQLCLGPLILIGLLALTPRRPQLAILLGAITALALLLLGVALYDVWTGLRGGFLVSLHTFDAVPLAIAFALLGVGGALSGAATVLALGRAAQTQRWSWFAGLAIFLVIGAVASVAAYDPYALVLWDARFHGADFFFTRSPKPTVLCRSIERVWFLLHRGELHLSPQTQASALLSTGVLPLRGTPGELA
jgi:hypothetical protein